MYCINGCGEIAQHGFALCDACSDYVYSEIGRLGAKALQDLGDESKTPPKGKDVGLTPDSFASKILIVT